MKIAFNTLGCKLNQAETESISWQFVDAGYQIVESIENADIYILNTCTVTNLADAKSRHLIRQAHRRNPEALIIVCGCYVEREQERITRIPGVSLVVNNANKSRIPSLLEKYLIKKEKTSSLSSQNWPIRFRTRSFIKIQEGCNSYCSYCIVPLVRSREYSTPTPQVLATIQKRISEGYKEIVLTGTNVGAYYDNGHNLQHLLKSVLTETSISRIRLSSLQPQEISREILLLWQDSRLCPHFHLSLQSGCNTTLRRMKRRYSIEQYRDSVSLIRNTVPDAAITTDVIVGFPGEDAIEFEESYCTCQNMRFARIHIFPFSARPGTDAAMMSDTVADNIKKERTQKMLSLADNSIRNFRSLNRGKVRPVLWESRDNTGYWNGLTDNYLPVKIRSTEALYNQITMTMVE